MMTPKNIKAKTAIEYFKKGYYEKGKWLGSGAEKLGLKGEINDYKVYENIVHGLSPDGSQNLNKREVHQDKRKAAVDCTFEAPKSVSITALIGGDERLIEAHNQAVEEVLQLMWERYAKTRIVLDGKTQEVIRTGNMVIAKHDHFESRELDPHIHSHCLVMNITQAPNGEWYSHLNDDVFRYQKLLGMMYQHRLAAKVEKIGYETEWKENGQFDIKGYSEKDLMSLSKRRQQILAVAGADASWASRERAWKKTRRNKEYVPLDELKVMWRESAKALELKIVKPREPKSELEPTQELAAAQISQENIQKVFDDAIKHCSEKRVAFKAEDIERFILSHSHYTIDVDALQPLIDSSAELIHLQEKDGVRYTTQTAVLRELATIELMKQGQDVVSAIAHPEVVEHHLEHIKLNQGRSLNQGQRQAVIMALSTTDQFIAWQGVAGAGKTYALNEVQALAQARGYVVKGFAPSAKAARVLSEDIKSEVQTVARLLASKLPKEIQPNQIWVVDEAGLMSAKEAQRLLSRAKQEQARVILVGDTKQLSAVEAGAPFKSLQQAGMKTAYLTESQRQKDSPKLKLAVDALAEGRIKDGFNLLVANGCVQTVAKEAKVDEIVASYTKLTPEEQAETLLLAGTHIERQRITKALRLALQAEGRLGEDVKLTQLKAKDLSDVEKSGYISQFALGDMVMPLRDYKRKRLTKNELYEVTGKTKDHLQLLAVDGTHLEVGLDFKKAIFEREEIRIAVGDRLMWKKNNQALQQVNGEEIIVKGINGSQVEIEERDGKTQTIDLAQPHHLDHAIVRTTYSSQGETASRVLIAADSTIGKESFYVAASRARLDLCFYTEDSNALLEWALLSKAQENSLDLIRQQMKEKMAAEVLVGASKKVETSSTATEKTQLKRKVSSPSTVPNKVGQPSSQRLFLGTDSSPKKGTEFGGRGRGEASSNTDNSPVPIDFPKSLPSSPELGLPRPTRSKIIGPPSPSVEVQSTVAPPRKRTVETHSVRDSNQPASPVKHSEQQTNVAAIFKAVNRQLPDLPDWLTVGKRVHCQNQGWGEVEAILGPRLVVKLDTGKQAHILEWSSAVKFKSVVPEPVEAFWTPTSGSVEPLGIEPNHWRELVEGSAIHPEIAARNFKSLQQDSVEWEHEAWGHLMYSDKLERSNTGRLSTGMLYRYAHIESGGWWCSAGVDPRCFKDLLAGQKPKEKIWGCFKPNAPRESLDNPEKFIKYEHPPKTDLSVFLLDVPDEIADRIYKQAGVSPSTSDRTSGFWYCVWKHNLPITITEGAKKAACLLSQGHATIGLPGIYAGYRSKDEQGNVIKAYLHEELAVFATLGREIRFCFDYETKPKTLRNIEIATSRTGSLMERLGAKVSVISLPGPTKGVDDFIKDQGPLAYEKLDCEALRLRDWREGNKEQHPALEQSENLSLTTNLCKSGQPLNLTNPLCTDRPSIEGCPDLHGLSRRPQERKERLRVKEAKQSSANGSLVGKPEQTSVAQQLVQQVVGIEAVNQLNDRDFMLLQQSVVDYFNASPPQPPPTTDKQLVQAEVDRLVTQINRLWTKQASQMALVNKMQKNPFRAWDKRYEKAVAAVEKTMAMITQSITQKDQKESQIKEWDRQGKVYKLWDNAPRTVEMRKIAEFLSTPQMQERLTNIHQAIQLEQERQAELGLTQQQNQKPGQRRGFR